MADIQVLPDPTSTLVHPEILIARFIQILQDNPGLGPLRIGAPAGHNETFTFKWPDEIRTESTGTLNGNITGTATETLTVVSSAVFKLSDQIQITGHQDSNFLDVIYEVTDPAPSGTTIDVTRVNGTGTTALTSSGQAIHITRGIADNRKPTSTEEFGKYTEHTFNDNVFQIFEATAEQGRAELMIANEGKLHGVASGTDLMQNTIDQRMFDMAFEIYNAVYYGSKRAATGVKPPMMEGVVTALNTTANTNRVNAGGNALVEDDINDSLEAMTNNGLPSNANILAIMSPTNFRVLSALKQTKVEYDTPPVSGELGQSVQRYNGEIMGTGISIISDTNMNDNKIPLINLDQIELVPRMGVQAIEMTDATVPGQFGERQILRAWWSTVVKGRNNLHGMIYNITP